MAFSINVDMLQWVLIITVFKTLHLVLSNDKNHSLRIGFLYTGDLRSCF